MTLVVVTINKFEELSKALSYDRMYSILIDVEGVLKRSLRRTENMAVKDTGEITAVLTDCNKEGALRVEGRLEQALEDYVARKRFTKRIVFNLSSATYPDDARTSEELIKKARES